MRFAILCVVAGKAMDTDEVFGTWETYDAALAQATIWERKADRLGLPGTVTFEVKQLHFKTRSTALADLWKMLEDG